MNKFNRKNGFSQIILLVIISFLAIALPITTKLVQNSQENRSSAALKSCTGSTPTACKGVAGCNWDTTVKRCYGTPTGQTTTPTPPKIQCTYTYSGWGACIDGKQRRTITGTSPSNCNTGTLEATVKDCDPAAPVKKICTSFTYGEWGPCGGSSVSPYQTRTATGSPAGCIGGNPDVTRSCATPIFKNGVCGSTNGSCVSGEKKEMADVLNYYVWACKGVNGGADTTCTIPMAGVNTKDCLWFPALTLIPNGKSQCFNAVGGLLGSDLVSCSNGVISKKDYSGKNCSCQVYLDGKMVGIPEGKSQCYNYLVSGAYLSGMHSCKNGQLSKVQYTGTNCTCNVFLDGKLLGIPEGKSQCYNFLGGILSQMLRCSGGKMNFDGVYLGPNCTGAPTNCNSPTGRNIGCPCSPDGSNSQCASGTCSGGKCVEKDGKLSFYYYNSSAKGCIASAAIFVDRNDCQGTHGQCYDSEGTCESANSCKIIGGSCKGSCSSSETVNAGGSGECGSSAKCCTTAICSSGHCDKCGSAYDCSRVGCSWDGTKCNTASDSSPVCTLGEKKCSGTTGYFECITSPTGAITWTTIATPCPSGKTCSGAGVCSGGSNPPYNPPADNTTICTANTVSTTECYDSTHLKKCDSAGTAWIQGDQCATGQVCTNGACGVGSTGPAKLSFKVAYMGVKKNVECLDNFTKVNLTVGIVGTGTTQISTVDVASVGDTNSAGFAIFKAENISLGAAFTGATNIYAKIKGQVHSKMYFCTKGQSAKNTSSSCNLAIDGTFNNLYEYPILAGDVDQDGIVNVVDFKMIRDDLDERVCGLKTDLNGDKVVNSFDIELYKIALEAKYDE